MTPESWIDGLVARHTAALTTTEFNRAARALSIRYVERRGSLPTRSPIDSAGKRAAFAAFYAPLHFLTAREIVRALGSSATRIETIIDLGCGTGVTSAAWAIACGSEPALRGIDKDDWVVREAKWNWTALGLHGRAARGDLVAGLETTFARESRRGLAGTAVVAGWSVNELDRPSRDRLRPLLLRAAGQGAEILVVEPIARAITPWWDEWASVFASAGGRGDDWKFSTPLPPALARIADTAGFSQEGLAARSLYLRS